MVWSCVGEAPNVQVQYHGPPGHGALVLYLQVQVVKVPVEAAPSTTASSAEQSSAASAAATSGHASGQVEPEKNPQDELKFKIACMPILRLKVEYNSRRLLSLIHSSLHTNLQLLPPDAEDQEQQSGLFPQRPEACLDPQRSAAPTAPPLPILTPFPLPILLWVPMQLQSQ